MRKPPSPYVKLGRQEYHNSKEREDNPFPPGTDSHKAWDRGWRKEHRLNSLD